MESTTPDHVPDQAEPRWPRLVVVRLLLPLGILGALALSAAATIDLARRQGVAVEVQPAAVAMLEIVSTAGTLLAIFATSDRLRARALVALSAASGVSLVAGVSAYGWFGAVAPLGLVGLVHLAAEAWQEERADRAGSSTTSTTSATTSTAQVVDSLTSERGAQTPALDLVVEPVRLPVGAEVVAVAIDDRLVEGPLTLVDDLRSRPSLPSERNLVGELREGGDPTFTRHRAKVVLVEARTGLREVSA